jgi:energy-coupling factor transporter transmembrane protein EcfT
MLARGYTGNFQTLNPHVMHSRDWQALALAAAAIVAVQIVGRVL